MVAISNPTEKTDGSANDTLYIYEPFKSAEPTVTLKTNIKPGDRVNSGCFGDFYYLADDKILYHDKKGNKLAWLDLSGNYHGLDFTTPPNGSELRGFSFSPKGDKVAWVLHKYNYTELVWEDTLMIADLDGSNKKELYKDKPADLHNATFMEIIKWSGDNIYVGGVPQLGGFYVPQFHKNMIKINVIDNKATEVIREGEGSPLGELLKVYDISANEEMATYILKNYNSDNSYNYNLYIRNTKTGTNDVIPINKDANFWGPGNAFFDKDGKKVVYEKAYQYNNITLKVRYAIVDLANKTTQEYSVTDFPYFIIKGHWFKKDDPNIQQIKLLDDPIIFNQDAWDNASLK